ncbi:MULTISPECIES: hypothetical protein [Halobacteriovorax]|uniref:Uncharacterized protein n=1 Tax=Halobacteriovorax vibrionivorans TaxID=2152716 RepID=A0ABY0IJ54_9BACT|nr:MULTISPECIES: hypothetical protein [Halobacteriovorax]RZF22519.1 hypothetical protein DAY19_01750 [Halobacteriovorax vibrionivorans]TGD47711.1 hypothetical protein EP118_07115 [Halobacteriovorax sp. Y22]
MVLKSLLKNPVLGFGILIFILFLFQLRDNNMFEQRAQSMKATSCRSVKVRLDKYLHPSWTLRCNDNNLEVTIPADVKVIPENIEDKEILRKEMYKALANSYISIAKYALPESLERTMMVVVKLVHPKMVLSSISEGKYVVKLATLKNKNNLARHIHQTIQVQEITE